MMHSLARIMLRVRQNFDPAGSYTTSWAQPVAIGVLALLLRLDGLGDKPFWMDEIVSLRRATAEVHDLVFDLLHHTHYPTYFLLLWLIGKIGTSQWLLRLPSAVFGAIDASLTCAVGSKVAGPRSGTIAGLLMASSPFAVQLGQEARSYTLVSCLIMTGLYGGLALLRVFPGGASHRSRGLLACRDHLGRDGVDGVQGDLGRARAHKVRAGSAGLARGRPALDRPRSYRRTPGWAERPAISDRQPQTGLAAHLGTNRPSGDGRARLRPMTKSIGGIRISVVAILEVHPRLVLDRPGHGGN